MAKELTPSKHIDKQIKDLPGWRGSLLVRLRRLILATSPDITEDWKWDTAVWVCKGNLVAGGVFKDHVKLNFFRGASLKDPKRLFNAGLEAKASRAIDFSENSKVDESALKQLVLEAIALNTKGKKK